jgi:hypothetical protein
MIYRMIIILLAFISSVDSFGFLASGTMFRNIRRRNARKRIARERAENDRIAREREQNDRIAQEHEMVLDTGGYVQLSNNRTLNN